MTLVARWFLTPSLNSNQLFRVRRLGINDSICQPSKLSVSMPTYKKKTMNIDAILYPAYVFSILRNTDAYSSSKETFAKCTKYFRAATFFLSQKSIIRKASKKISCRSRRVRLTYRLNQCLVVFCIGSGYA